MKFIDLPEEFFFLFNKNLIALCICSCFCSIPIKSGLFHHLDCIFFS